LQELLKDVFNTNVLKVVNGGGGGLSTWSYNTEHEKDAPIEGQVLLSKEYAKKLKNPQPGV
jgi:hypothetical protein